jgi:E3 ubiquitin ligase
MVYVVIIIFMLVGVALFYNSFRTLRQYRLIKDTPRSKIRSLAMGIVEIHGHVESDEFIKSPFSKTDCVYYKYEIKEYRKHTERDSKGHSKIKYQWDTISFGDQRINFMAVDETGKVPVNPDGAEITVNYKKTFYQHTGTSGGFSSLLDSLKNWGKGDQFNIYFSEMSLIPVTSDVKIGKARVGDRKYLEYYIESNDSLFVLGTAANDRSVQDNVIIKQGENEKTFIIADRSEKETLKNLRKSMLAGFIIGPIFIIGGILALLNIDKFQ